jgi:catechol 2,3-dioxygenase-like lactoylglutathione lyase family enzyme
VAFRERTGVISGVSQVVVPVRDQDEALEFWTERIGFQLMSDETFGDERWIELGPGDEGPRIVLSLRAEGDARPSVRDEHPHSPVFFTCDDVNGTYRELHERGVDFPTPPVQMHFGWWAMFADQDGTRYALGQSD